MQPCLFDEFSKNLGLIVAIRQMERARAVVPKAEGLEQFQPDTTTL